MNRKKILKYLSILYFIILFSLLFSICSSYPQQIKNHSIFKSFNLSNSGFHSALRSLLKATPHITGTGTSTDPYLLHDAADFDSIRYLGISSDKYYKLANDIDLKDFSVWSPFGTSHSVALRFEAKFNGDNHKISNITLNPVLDYPSLFGIVNGATIVNLKIENISLNFSGINPKQYIGLLVARNYLSSSTYKFISINNVNIDYKPTNTISTIFFGAFGSSAGTYVSIIQDCHVSNFNADIRVGTSSGNDIGGFIGSGAFSISRCSFVGSLNTERTNVNWQSNGLFVGGYLLTGSSITDCFVRGELKTSEPVSTATIELAAFSVYRVQMLRCYSAVIIDDGSTSSYQSAFIVDYTNGAGAVTNCYYDSNLYNRDGRRGGTGATAKTTSELQTQSTFTGWDFTNTWAINPTINSGYPYLK